MNSLFAVCRFAPFADSFSLDAYYLFQVTETGHSEFDSGHFLFQHVRFSDASDFTVLENGYTPLYVQVVLCLALPCWVSLGASMSFALTLSHARARTLLVR